MESCGVYYIMGTPTNQTNWDPCTKTRKQHGGHPIYESAIVERKARFSQFTNMGEKEETGVCLFPEMKSLPFD